ncbi:hypothetical protein D918_05185 [Trichuris suis]|nr:hypothetical protein D918_05185 [Trichuris suis]
MAGTQLSRVLLTALPAAVSHYRIRSSTPESSRPKHWKLLVRSSRRNAANRIMNRKSEWSSSRALPLDFGME